LASRNAQLADAVKTALNAGPAQAGFTLTFTATRRAVPLTDLKALANLTVTVIAGGDESDRTGRDTDEHTLTVLVGIEKTLTSASPDPSNPSANTEIDQLMLLVEQVGDFFGPTTVDPSLGLFVQSTIKTLSDVPSLLTQQVFRGVVAVTFLLAI
jgi:hypothetical protein